MTQQEWYDDDEFTDTCPEHGVQHVVETGTTLGADPWATSMLACGHEVLGMLPDMPNEIIRTWSSSRLRDAELRSLDDEQRSLYNEAIDCGATHNDAMEAATTYGYTR